MELIIRYQFQGLYLQGVKYLNKQVNLICLFFYFSPFFFDHEIQIFTICSVTQDISFIEKCQIRAKTLLRQIPHLIPFAVNTSPKLMCEILEGSLTLLCPVHLLPIEKWGSLLPFNFYIVLFLLPLAVNKRDPIRFILAYFSLIFRKKK